jgi:hypothetical protein
LEGVGSLHIRCFGYGDRIHKHLFPLNTGTMLLLNSEVE